jgi:fatty-acyl-CoA synthase
MGTSTKKKGNGARRVAAPRKSPWADLKPGSANTSALSPIAFLPRAAEVYPERTAVIHGDRRFTYREFHQRSTRLASALKKAGVRRGDVVSAMLPNVPAMLEAHHGVPAAGAVLNTINTRLDADTVAYILEHSGAKLFITDPVFAPVVAPALKQLKRKLRVIEIDDEYEAFLATGKADEEWLRPAAESDPIALNYTSGTTGRPKGVVYHHRGTFLESVGNILAWAMPDRPVYLWTLPMFHCNGWCFPWSVTAMAGTHVCLRAVEPKRIFELIAGHGVTHMCGAPTVLAMLVGAPEHERKRFEKVVHIQTGGSPPPAKVIKSMEELGFEVLHIYGMTELQGPSTLCAPQEHWQERYSEMARQGVRYPVVEGHIVAEPKSCRPVPKDGRTIGEILVRGNTVMLGYLKDAKATAEAFAGGWMHTGDLAVWHPGNYVEIKDRKKDIIISGGENISSVEVEIALYKHPATQLAAVVARPDEKWGETPCAFIQLKPGAQATESEVIDWCRQNLARFKIPKKVVFGPLPTTATGKIQKYVLRERAKGL